MQLASGFMQLAAVGRRRNIVHFHCLFEGKTVNSALEWGLPYSKFSFGVVFSSEKRSGMTFYGYPIFALLFKSIS